MPSRAVIDEALERGAYPVVKDFLLGGILHWCVIVGKDGLEYMARDPLRDDDKPVNLSELKAKVWAVRVIRRAEQGQDESLRGEGWNEPKQGYPKR